MAPGLRAWLWPEETGDESACHPPFRSLLGLERRIHVRHDLLSRLGQGKLMKGLHERVRLLLRQQQHGTSQGIPPVLDRGKFGFDFVEGQETDRYPGSHGVERLPEREIGHSRQGRKRADDGLYHLIVPSDRFRRVRNLSADAEVLLEGLSYVLVARAIDQKNSGIGPTQIRPRF